MDKPQLISHLEKSLPFTIFDTRWIPCSAKFIVLGSMPRGTGIIQIYEINSGNLELLKEFEKKSAFKCGTFGASSLRDRNLATGDFSGKLQVWDLEDPNVAVYSEEAHQDIINCIDGIGGTTINCGAPELATGSRDGAVKVWDMRQKGAPVAIMEPSRDDLRRDCWCVAFGDSHNQEERSVCAGYDNGDVKMFDLRKMKVRWETNVRNGVCGIEFDRRDIPMNKLVCGTLEGGIHCWDLRTQHPEKGFACVTERGAGGGYGAAGGSPTSRATVWLCRHLPQNRELFASCGGAGSIRIWKYNYPDRRTKDGPNGALQGVAGNLELIQSTVLSTQPVCAFDWSPDRIGLAVCGAFDQTLRVLIATKLNLL